MQLACVYLSSTLMPYYFTPGPDSYILPKPIPPTALIGEKLDPQRPPDNPAPNTYTLPSTPHEGKTFGLRSEHPLKERAPPPNTYSFEQPRAQSAHFTHRAFPWKCECCNLGSFSRNKFT